MADGILLTSNFSNTTGFAWKFFRRLQDSVARAFHQRGFDIHLSFGRIEGTVSTVDSDIPVGTLEFDLLKNDRSKRKELTDYIRDNRIKYVYVTDFSSWSPLFLRLRMAGVRRIVVHDHSSSPSPLPPMWDHGVTGEVKAMIHRSRLLSADNIYACSDFVRQRLMAKARYPDARITVIPHGIDTGRFGATPRVESPVPLRIVTIARAVYEKGGAVLIDAAAQLRSLTDIPFQIIYGGSGPNLEDLVRLAEGRGISDIVEFVGEVMQTDGLLSSADIVVVPSVWGDAAPLSVLEAMASTRPLIATSVGGIPEQVGATDAAILIPPNDASALAQALHSLLLDPERRLSMGANGRRRVEENFSEPRFHHAVISSLMRDFDVP
jgi:glycosyltransferase involved in cell wall biosynthesis